MVNTLQKQTLTSIPLLMMAFSLVFPPVVQSLSHVWLFVTPCTASHQVSLSFRITWSLSNSCPLSQWCHPNISSSVLPFFCLQSFPASGSFPVSWLFPSGDQSTGASASASVFPMNTQDWFPLGCTGLILLSKGLSRVFSSTTIPNYQFFGTQIPLWFNSHICTWLLEKPWLWLYGPLSTKCCLWFLTCCLGLSKFFFQETCVF